MFPIVNRICRKDLEWKIKLRKTLKPYVSNFFKNFSSINWDFLINFLIDKFFFKYNVDVKYFLVFVLFFKDFFFNSFLSFSLNEKKADVKKFFTNKIDVMCRDLLSSQLIYNTDNMLIFFLNLFLEG